MHLDTKYEIQEAARRLIPMLVKANQIAAVLCFLAACVVILSLVVVAMTDDAYINGVTDSGEVHVIPIK